MDKGEQTRLTILERAARVFSLSGYSGTSMDDLVRATGLTKGGIYNHFGSKEALLVEAFEFAQDQMQQRFREMLQGRRDARSRLLAVTEFFRSLIVDPLFPGGCILLSTAVEADDTNPALRRCALQAVNAWREYITRTIQRGIERQQIKAGTDPARVLTTLLATLEGAVMLCKLHGEISYMDQAIEHLITYIEGLQVDTPTTDASEPA